MFSQRTNWELTPNKISDILGRLRQSGEKILDLTESNPTRCGFLYPQKEILSSLSQPQNMLYQPSARGSLEAREAVCRYYAQKNIHVDPDQVFLTSSTSEGYSFLFRLLADAGETVLFPRPSYPLFEFLVGLNDLNLDFYSLHYDGNWRLDTARLRSAFHPSVKAMVAVNPNNPTGSSLKGEEIKEVNAFCLQKNLALISDEVFLDYVFDEKKILPSLAGNTDALTFVLGGLSKTLGLPQMKLSWVVVAGPKELVHEAVLRLEVIADTYLSVNSPVQNSLAAWLNLQTVIQNEILGRIRKNLGFLKCFPSKDVFECLSADGGWYAVLKLFAKCHEEKFVLELLSKDHVFAHPGYFFDFEDEPYLVISLLPPQEVFQEGLAKISQRIQSFAKE